MDFVIFISRKYPRDHINQRAYGEIYEQYTVFVDIDNEINTPIIYDRYSIHL